MDTATSWIYIGRLERVTEASLVLADVDAHDNTDTPTSKERYILDCRQTGVRANRKQVVINLNYLVGISPLEDILEF